MIVQQGVLQITAPDATYNKTFILYYNPGLLIVFLLKPNS